MKKLILIKFCIVWLAIGSKGEEPTCQTVDYKEQALDTCRYSFFNIQNNEVLPSCSKCNGTAKRLEVLFSNLFAFPGEIFSHFKNIDTVLMIDQNIQEIKNNSFDNAEALTRLKLENNKIKALRHRNFYGASKLEKIFIYQNKISKILITAFEGLTNLKLLDMGDNYIESFEDTTFDHLPNLESLLLHNNKISFLSDKIFRKNTKLKSISLNGNLLNSVSIQVFSKLVNLKRLQLRGNECVNRNWYSDAFKNIKQVEESLVPCSNIAKKKAFFTALKELPIFNEKFKEISNKMQDFIETGFSKKIEELETNVNVKMEEVSSGLDVKFKKFANILKSSMLLFDPK